MPLAVDIAGERRLKAAGRVDIEALPGAPFPRRMRERDAHVIVGFHLSPTAVLLSALSIA